MKFNVIEFMYNPEELTITKLVGDLQVFKLHNLLARQKHVFASKGKSIVLKTLRVLFVAKK